MQSEINLITIYGAGPVGLFTAAILSEMDKFKNTPIEILEKRVDYATRKRYLVLQDLKHYFDGDLFNNLPRRFEGMMEQLPLSIQSFLDQIFQGNAIRLDELQLLLLNTFNLREHVRITEVSSLPESISPNKGNFIIDCSGYNSPLKKISSVFPRHEIVMEYVAIVSFKLKNIAQCNSECKVKKNRGNHYFLIPYIDGIHQIHGEDCSHVTCLISITEQEYQHLKNCRTIESTFDSIPRLKLDIDRFLSRYPANSVFEEQFLAIPLNFYGVRYPYFDQSIVQIGDSAMGSPYFQSVTNGFVSAVALMYHLKMSNSLEICLNNYKEFYEQFRAFIWTRTQLIAQTRANNLAFLDAARGSEELVEKNLSVVSEVIFNVSMTLSRD